MTDSIIDKIVLIGKNSAENKRDSAIIFTSGPNEIKALLGLLFFGK